MVIAIAVLVGIIVVLFKYDGIKQPEWPYQITLNTLIAIMSTILRALLIVVAASGKLPCSVTNYMRWTLTWANQ